MLSYRLHWSNLSYRKTCSKATPQLLAAAMQSSAVQWQTVHLWQDGDMCPA